MPHIVLEHNVEDKALIAEVCKSLHKILSEQDTVKLASIKTRSIYVENLSLGDGAETSFSHVHLKLLPGRSEDLKLKMSHALLGILKEHVGGSALSVEVSELKSYSKV